MTSIMVHGGQTLQGSTTIPGDKVVAVHILCAATVACASRVERIVIRNLPGCSDVDRLVTGIGDCHLAEFQREGNEVHILPSHRIVQDITRLGQFRCSICMAAPLALLFRRLLFSRPGGCNFSDRPIDRHLALLDALGMGITTARDAFVVESRSPPRSLNFDCSTPYGPSVGVTCHALIAAFAFDGPIYLTNVALDPAASAVTTFVAKATGRAVSQSGRDIFLAEGSPSHSFADVSIPLDSTVAFTYIAAVTTTGGELHLPGVRVLTKPIKQLLENLGVTITGSSAGIIASADSLRHPGLISLAPWPGLPSDIGPIVSAALAPHQGRTTIHDSVYPRRSAHVPGLQAMGYDVRAHGQEVSVHGRKPSRVPVKTHAPDIRSGAALIVGALARPGSTNLENFEQITRGYERMESRLRSLGAMVQYDQDPQPL